jgi:hypothetical protein
MFSCSALSWVVLLLWNFLVYTAENAPRGNFIASCQHTPTILQLASGKIAGAEMTHCVFSVGSLQSALQACVIHGVL